MALVNNFGVLLPTRGVLVYAGSNVPRAEQTWQMAKTAEYTGYDSVWVGDSITSKPRVEPLTSLAAVIDHPRCFLRSRWPRCFTPAPVDLQNTPFRKDSRKGS